MSPLSASLKNHRHLLLLVVLLLNGFFQPLARGLVGGLIIYDCVLAFVVIGVVLVVFDGRRDRLFALARWPCRPW